MTWKTRLEKVFKDTEELNRRTILEVVPPGIGGALLDVGCGTGEFTLRVASRAGVTSLHGVELVDHIAAEATARGIEVAQTDLGKALPYGDSSFEVVHSNQVIEHLDNTDIFLSEIRRVLKPGGAAVISTNNLASWHNIGALVAGWQPTPSHVSDMTIVGNPTNYVDGAPGYLGQMHRRIFTNRGLRELAAFHGLVIVEDRTAGYYPLPPRAAARASRWDARHGAFIVQRFTPAGA